jgi:type II secretory pathway pseudopilin PulG
MISLPSRLRRFPRSRVRGFTMVELMISSTIGLALLAAIGAIVLMSLRIVHKNQQLDAATTATRLVQEHLNREMSIAISQLEPIEIRPSFSGASATPPVRYSQIDYRVPIGSFGTVVSNTAKNLSVISVNFPASFASRVADYPKVGDYFLMDTPNLLSGVRITAISPADSLGDLTITLASSIEAATERPLPVKPKRTPRPANLFASSASVATRP